ncbi:hypothetical protein ACFL27_12820, partial [candidate division CSSED10-310 bacterium]
LYFLGQRKTQGNFFYFPVAFLLKTPLSVIHLFVLLLVSMWLKKYKLHVLAKMTLYTFPILYFLYALFTDMTLGQRYLVPVYPFLFVFLGGSINLFRQSVIKKIVVGGFLLWFVISSVLIYPDYLAYFNELAGGPRGGIRYLGDSNLDWGQDLKRLKPWLEEHHVQEIKLGYFGTALPQYYGIQFQWLPSVGFLNDQAGTKLIHEGDYLAVSATCLQGFYFENMEQYNFLKNFEPIDHIGYTIYLYHITPDRLRDK